MSVTSVTNVTTVEGAAVRYGIPQSTLYRMIRQGLLRPVRYGSFGTFLEESEVEALARLRQQFRGRGSVEKIRERLKTSLV